MQFRISFLLLVFSTIISGCSINKTAVQDSPAIELQLQTVLNEIYKAHPTAIGIMAHVESPDRKISWSGAAGHPAKSIYETLSANRPALIASNTKTYVSATMLRLVEQGKVALEQPIENLLSDKTRALLANDGYDLQAIQVVHLLSHTSGIFDYVNAQDFFARTEKNAKHRWTRDEQIALAISDGQPLAKAGEHFSYADTNFSLLSEIIEGLTDKPFYTAIREVLDYEKIGLHATWFSTLETKPENVPSLVNQYAGELNLDSYTLDHSFDLYGGGGIAATTKDLALFSQNLFSGKFFKKPETLNLIYTKIKTNDEVPVDYFLGLSGSQINGLQAYGHGGFWGSVVQYIPELNASIAVFILERDQRILRKNVLEGLLTKLKQPAK